MKIWKFYKIDEDKPKLYAITGVKEYAKEFKEIRNMNIFKVEKEDVDKELYTKFINANRAAYLEHHLLWTQSSDKDNRMKGDYIEVLLTQSEKDFITEKVDLIMGEFDYMDWLHIYSLDMFKDNITKALINIGYLSVFMYNSQYIDYYDITESGENAIVMPEIDEYKVLMRGYSNLFNITK